MVYSIIKKSQLEGAYRLDAEYYQPEFLKLEKDLEKFRNNLKTFEDVLEAGNSLTGGATPLGANYSEKGVMFLRVQNIMQGYFDLSNVVFIDKNIHEKQLKRSRLINNDVLLTITGVSYGKSAVYKSEIGGANINQHSVRMHFKDEAIPEYIAMFLNSKYGRFQSDRKVTGDTRPALAYEEIKNYKIPLLENKDQQKIKSLYDESLKSDNSSKNFYQQAENLLLDELGLNNFDIDVKLSSVVSLSDTKNANRMDAEYFQEKYKKLVEVLYKNDIKFLNEITEQQNDILKINPQENYNYIEIGDINVGNSDSSFNAILGRDLPVSAKIRINGGELLVSKVRPTRGAISIISDSWNKNFVASSAFVVLKVSSPMRECLQVILRSVVGRLQLEKPTTGTSYPTITNDDVKNIIIPILPKGIQQKISDLVKKSFDARKKAKDLLEEAKNKVEDMIEKGGKNG